MSDKTCGNCGWFKQDIVLSGFGNCTCALPMYAEHLLDSECSSEWSEVEPTSDAEDCQCHKPQERKDK